MTNRKSTRSASVEVEMDAGEKETPQSGDYVIIWSSMPHMLRISMPKDRYERTKRGDAFEGSFSNVEETIHPGRNKISKEVWEWAKKAPTIQKRLDYRTLVVASGETARPMDVVSKLEAMQEGHAPDKTHVFQVLGQSSVDPAIQHKEDLTRHGFKDVEDGVGDLGSIVAGQ